MAQETKRIFQSVHFLIDDERKTKTNHHEMWNTARAYARISRSVTVRFCFHRSWNFSRTFGKTNLNSQICSRKLMKFHQVHFVCCWLQRPTIPLYECNRSYFQWLVAFARLVIVYYLSANISSAKLHLNFQSLDQYPQSVGAEVLLLFLCG